MLNVKYKRLPVYSSCLWQSSGL